MGLALARGQGLASDRGLDVKSVLEPNDKVDLATARLNQQLDLRTAALQQGAVDLGHLRPRDFEVDHAAERCVLRNEKVFGR